MKRINAWSLDGGRVGLVIYDVRFSEVHRMPFADILFLSQKTFMPMVRLALARYQHHAIQGCHLSPIVQADFVPLAPGRTVTVTRMGPASWGLTMRGDGYRTPDRSTSEVQAHIEVVEKALPEDTALWRPTGDPVRLSPASVEAWRYHWTGQVRIEDPDFLSFHWRRRLVIQEFEPFDHNGPPDAPLADHSRLISAHAVPL